MSVRPAVPVSLALRGLAAGRGTTAMLVLAIAIAAGFQIPNAANLAGLEVALLEDGLARGTGDIRVEPIGKPRFVDGTAEAARLRELAGARAAVPTLTFAVAIGNPRRRTIPFFGLAVHGIDVGAQRVAIARALVNKPKLLGSTGPAVLVATHDPEVAARAGRILRMRDGKLQP